MRPGFRVLVTLLSVCVLCGVARAHSLWLEPSDYHPGATGTIDVSIFIGRDMVGDEYPNIPAWVEEFSVFSHGSRRPVEGEVGRDPAGFFELTQPGTHVVGYKSRRAFLDADAETYEDYLRQEGLEKVIEARAASRTSSHTGREIYYRCAKTLITAGEDARDAAHRHRFGCRFEMMLHENPNTARVGDTLTVQLLYEGAPVSGVQVVAYERENPGARHVLRSDAEGRARFPVDRPGVWFVKAVEARPLATREAQWESFWTSLTFEVR